MKVNKDKVELLKAELLKMRDDNLKKGIRIKGNTNIVNGLTAIDLLEHYDYNFDVLKKDEKAAGGVAKMVAGGCFLIYNDDIQEFINNYLGMNPNKKFKSFCSYGFEFNGYRGYREYSYDESFKLYTHLCGAAFRYLEYQELKNNTGIFEKE